MRANTQHQGSGRTGWPASLPTACILLAVGLVGCSGWDGPHVVNGNEVRNRLRTTCFQKSVAEFGALAPPADGTSADAIAVQLIGSPLLLCGAIVNARLGFPATMDLDGFYFETSGVDYCVEAIVNIRANTMQEFVDQFAIVMNAVCRLERAQAFDGTHFLEGEPTTH